MRASTLRHAGVTLAIALLSSACALFGRSEGRTGPLVLTVHAANRLNPDELGRSLPTIVRLYQLRRGSRLEAADFDALYRSDKAFLAEDLLQVDELVVSPGTTASREITYAQGATVLAAVAIVRRPSGDTWRTLIPIPNRDKRAAIELHLEGYRISR